MVAVGQAVKRQVFTLKWILISGSKDQNECGDSEIVCALVLFDGEINLIANSNGNVKGHNVRFIYKARK
jgi:hypothetical protein